MPTESRPWQDRTPPKFTPGFYRHFKGGTYYALCLARDACAMPRAIVVYYGDGFYYTRPFQDAGADSWTDEVLVGGFWVPRFERITEAGLIVSEILEKLQFAK